MTGEFKLIEPRGRVALELFELSSLPFAKVWGKAAGVGVWGKGGSNPWMINHLTCQ